MNNNRIETLGVDRMLQGYSQYLAEDHNRFTRIITDDYSIEELCAFIASPRANLNRQLKQMVISCGVLGDNGVVLHERVWYPTADQSQESNWVFEANNVLQTIEYTHGLNRDNKFGAGLTLGFYSRGQRVIYWGDEIFTFSIRGANYRYKAGQLEFSGWKGSITAEPEDDITNYALATRGQDEPNLPLEFKFDSKSDPVSVKGFTSDGRLIEEIYLPKTIEFKSWAKRLLDKNGQVLRDPTLLWQGWFKELGARYIFHQ